MRKSDFLTGRHDKNIESSGESMMGLIYPLAKRSCGRDSAPSLSSFHVLFGGCLTSLPPSNRSLFLFHAPFVRAAFVAVKAAGLSVV